MVGSALITAGVTLMFLLMPYTMLGTIIALAGLFLITLSAIQRD